MMTKKEISIFAFITIVALALSIWGVLFINNDTSKVEAKTIGYYDESSGSIMSDTYYNKRCLVKYDFAGEEKEEFMKITSREVKPSYTVHIDKAGHIVEYDWIYLTYFGISASVAMLGMCGAMIWERKMT